MRTSDFCVIVRAVGERTVNVCCDSFRAKAPDAPFCLVEEAPFLRTLREGLKRGIESGKPWVVSVDADVIPSDDAIAKALGWMRSAAADVGVITGMVQDKLFFSARYMAFRAYRADALESMLALLPAEGEEVRPESTTIDRLIDSGFRHETVPELVGLHDYEQYYRDIYRKAFLHAHKHLSLTHLYLPLWRKYARSDADYRVALAGFADGLQKIGSVECTKDSTDYNVKAALDKLGLHEKQALSNGEICVKDEVDKLRLAIDSGEIAPVTPHYQANYDEQCVEIDVADRIDNIFEMVSAWEKQSPELSATVIAAIRRKLPDYLLLHSFRLSYMVKYTILRMMSFLKKRISLAVRLR